MPSAALTRPESGATALGDFDRSSLADHLVEATGTRLATCERTAAKALRLAFRADGGLAWTDETLTAAGIGSWARASLLALSPAPRLELATKSPSADGTIRLLFRTVDGALVESVIIPAADGRTTARTTLCISSQVGCARACTFCETGRHGYSRQLRAGEIVDQVRLARRVCESDAPIDLRGICRPTSGARAHDENEPERPITNIVFRGMGEPFDNLSEVLRAVSLLSDDVAFAYPASRITVSTVGVADKFETFFANTKAELAISLHAPDDARRSAIMPINKRFDLATLRDALLKAKPANRRVMFQYVLFADFNDSEDDADALAAYVAPVRCRVNVIPANPGPDPRLVSPSAERIDAFVARLNGHGVTTLVRRPRGRDVGGACGQLAGARRLELAPVGPE